uniref:Uncharacterized protein n=1 Tax=Zea mays TaxID=4577 RepID=B6SLV9_MAIZE|nr:hypothetical protein [Zea mays]
MTVEPLAHDAEEEATDADEEELAFASLLAWPLVLRFSPLLLLSLQSPLPHLLPSTYPAKPPPTWTTSFSLASAGSRSSPSRPASSKRKTKTARAGGAVAAGGEASRAGKSQS